jgi:hypothetical protein
MTMSIGGLSPIVPPLSTPGPFGIGYSSRNNTPEDVAQELKAIFPHGVTGLLGKNFMKTAIGAAGDPGNAKGITGGLADDLIDRPKTRPPTPEQTPGGQTGGQDGRSDRRPARAERGQEGLDHSPSRHDLLAARRERAAEIARQAEEATAATGPLVPPGAGTAFKGVLSPRPEARATVTQRSAERLAALQQAQANGPRPSVATADRSERSRSTARTDGGADGRIPDFPPMAPARREATADTPRPGPSSRIGDGPEAQRGPVRTSAPPKTA